jgi:hypothetical protein
VEPTSSFFLCSELELYLSNEAIDLFEPSEDYRGRPRAQKETTEGCHCDDVARNSRRPKAKGKVVDSSKRNKKHDRDADADGGIDDADADGDR